MVEDEEREILTTKEATQASRTKSNFRVLIMSTAGVVALLGAIYLAFATWNV